jgi:hypothetical protein
LPRKTCKKRIDKFANKGNHGTDQDPEEKEPLVLIGIEFPGIIGVNQHQDNPGT